MASLIKLWEKIWEFQYAFKYVHQTPIIVNKVILLIKDVGWYGSVNFGGKSFDSVHLILS